jgi:hypothetical protein
MLPKLPAGATHYTDNFSTGFVPSNNPADSLIQEVFNLYYNPGVSVIGDEIVGIADVDVYEGLGDDQGHYYTFCAKPGCTASGAGTLWRRHWKLPEQSGLFHVRMEFDGQFQLPRAATESQKAG